jgi:hypothetical protein
MRGGSGRFGAAGCVDLVASSAPGFKDWPQRRCTRSESVASTGRRRGEPAMMTRDRFTKFVCRKNEEA